MRAGVTTWQTLPGSVASHARGGSENWNDARWYFTFFLAMGPSLSLCTAKPSSLSFELSLSFLVPIRTKQVLYYVCVYLQTINTSGVHLTCQPTNQQYYSLILNQHQPPAISQSTVLFSHNKSTPAINHSQANTTAWEGYFKRLFLLMEVINHRNHGLISSLFAFSRK